MNESLHERFVIFEQFYIIFLFTIGFIGNTISFCLFSLTDLRNQEASYFLAAIALCDNGFLVTLLFINLIHFNIDLYHKSLILCKLCTYLTYIFSFLSVWYVVVLTIERFIVVYFPFKRADLCTHRRNLFAIIVLFLMSCIIYSFSLFSSGIEPENQMCVTLSSWFNIANVLALIDSCLTMIIPLILIFVFNVSIILKLLKLTNNKRNREINDPNEQNLIETKDILRSSISDSRKQKYSTSTKMLLVISNAFLLMNIPMALNKAYYFCKNYFSNSQSIETSGSEEILERVSCYIYYLNFSLNFFLYSIYGEKFRLKLKEVYSTIKKIFK